MVPIALDSGGPGALLALGIKRSEEPYSREDQELMEAIAASLARLIALPRSPAEPMASTFEECPECGRCYETTSRTCAIEGAALTPVPLSRTLAGRYRLERRRGRGGMGTVYEATDLALERLVAVKVIRGEMVDSR